jgi:uncharacterized protein YndB with AHSA1/START domain
VRFQRTYRHPVERVWAAITESDELAHWFPSKVVMDQRVGGSVDFSEDSNTTDSRGTVLVIDPPQRLAYTWGGDELHFDLAPDGTGGCVLTLVNVLDDRSAAARNAAGWSLCLAALDRLVDDAPQDSANLDWKPYYDAYVAEGMPSGAPIPGQPA